MTERDIYRNVSFLHWSDIFSSCVYKQNHVCVVLHVLVMILRLCGYVVRWTRQLGRRPVDTLTLRCD